MTIKLCIEDGCETAQFCRKLCNKHYQFHKYHGTLDSISPNTKHSITNVDLSAMVGDCSICGPAAGVMMVSLTQLRCKTKAKHHKRRKLLYAGDKRIPTHEINAAYTKMYADQGGVCAVCGKVNPDDSSLAVDHCHETGKIRGLLCSKCNSGIGMLGDNIEGLQAALDYLKDQ
jgi:hypothetical protein